MCDMVWVSKVKTRYKLFSGKEMFKIKHNVNGNIVRFKVC